MQKIQPLSMKTVIVPASQNPYGRDIVRFTADYAASDMFAMCIGCYPPCQDDLKGVVVISTDDSTFYPLKSDDLISMEAKHDVDLRKATNACCHYGDPVVMEQAKALNIGAPDAARTHGSRYWDV